ncbi:MAG: prephenate dehydrogenase [Euryarchaeota archaeon]|nr:prephenate dehydrogenase [Euryarchaeota archaeon]
MKVLIIGGTGEMGQWFAPFFKEHGYEVTVWGHSHRVDVAERLGVDFAADLDGAVDDSDIVIISVPIDITTDVIRQVAPGMKTGSLLMDLTSLKKGPVEAMQRYAPADVEIIGTHPMFGPSIPSLHGQIVILSPVEGRCEIWFDRIHSLLEDNGAHIEIIDPTEHDQFVSVVQGLTHFAYITIGSTLQKLDFDVKSSRRFMSPVYEIMLDFVGRILGQNPYLYALIQMENPEVLKVHDVFLKECEQVSSMVRNHETDEFCQNMKDAAVHFGDTHSALRRSDKLINSKIAEFEELIHSIGKERGIRHIYSGVTHMGIIEKVTPRTVSLTEGGSTTILLIENVQLLSDSELIHWKGEVLKHCQRDISAFIPHGSDPEMFREIIDMDERIISVDIVDTYTGLQDSDHVSVTFRIRIIEDLQPGDVQGDVEEMLRRLGCRIR